MHNTSLIVQRSQETLQAHQHLAIVAPPKADDLSYLAPERVFCFDYGVYLSHRSTLQTRVQFSMERDAQLYDAALFYMPKSKAELELLFHFIGDRLQVGATIYLAGEKKEGIASGAKLLSHFGDQAEKIDSAKHCQFWRVTLTNTQPAFELEQWFSFYDISLQETSLRVAAIPGVFSFNRLDEGTHLLLTHLPKKLLGRVLDFGCGAGVIGAFVKRRYPEVSVEMVDINLFALLCSERTLQLNDLQAQVYASDGWSEVKGRVDAVLSNPPFHAGVKTEYTTTEQFIAQSADKTTRFSPFIIVANGFLKYGPIIEQALGAYKLLAENGKFKVYYARR